MQYPSISFIQAKHRLRFVHVDESSDFFEELVEKSWGKEMANESGLKFILCFDSSFSWFVQTNGFASPCLIRETALGEPASFSVNLCI
ncbi:hypothetical protein Tco_0052035 [Tanacetum coccineum]